MNNRDPYELLGISKDASRKEMSDALRKKVAGLQKILDDVSASEEEKEEASKKASEINSAYNELKNRVNWSKEKTDKPAAHSEPTSSMFSPKQNPDDRTKYSKEEANPDNVTGGRVKRQK